MAKARTPAKRKPNTDLIAASVTYGEAVSVRQSYSSREAGLIQRGIVQTLHRAISLNAMVCAEMPIRMYRKAGSAGSKLYKGVKVSRKATAYLRGDTGYSPGRKAAMYAQHAGEVEEVIDHPYLTLMRRPDPFLTGIDWSYLRYWFKECTGVSYVYKGERVDGAPSSLYHLFPQFTRVMPDKNQFIKGYLYGRDSTAIMQLPPEDVAYYRQSPSPINPLEGISWPQACVMDADLENAAIKASLAQWINGGYPSAVIELDPARVPNLDVLSQIRADFNANYRGVNNAGKPLFILNGKVVNNPIKPTDLGYLDVSKRAEANIRKSAGIPESVWEMGSASLASAYMSDPQYMGQTIGPRCRKQAEEDTELLLPEWGIEPGEYWLVCDNPVAEDKKALEDGSRLDVQSGIIVANEARAIRGLDPSDEPTADLLCFNGVPISAMHAQVTTATLAATPKPDAGKDATGGTDAPAQAAQAPASDVQATALNGAQVSALAALASQVAVGGLPKDSARALAGAALPLVPPETLDAIFNPLEAFTPEPPPASPAPTGKQPVADTTTTGGAGGDAGSGQGDMGSGDTGRGKAQLDTSNIHTKDDRLVGQPPRVTQALDDLQARVEAWYKAAMVGGVTDAGEVNLATFQPMLNEIMAEGIREVMDLAAADALATPGMPADAAFDLPANPYAVEWARTEAARLVTQVSDTLEAKLRATITEGQEKGQSISQVQSAIREEAPDFSAARAENIARTETSGAANEGALLAYKANGVTLKDFILAGGPCPKCQGVRDAYPDPIGIDDVYVVDGVPYGRPPFHQQCRCTTVPAFEKVSAA